MTTQPYVDELQVARVGIDVIGDSLKEGFADFKAQPTAAIFLIVIYPFIGLLLYRFAFDQALLPLLFPLASGFALVGPITAAGLYEISRRLERSDAVNPISAFRSLSGEVFMPLFLIGLLLLMIYAMWIGTAQLIYQTLFGDFEPESLGALLSTVLSTTEGWTLIVVGCGVGFLFALCVLAVGAISLPAVIDRKLGPAPAVALSVRAFLANPVPMLAWGFVIAVGLVLGSLPAFLGLMIVLPVFGHATWHLYRKIVAPPA